MKKLAILLVTAILLFSFCGCVWFMEQPEEEQKTNTVYEPVEDIIEATPEPETPQNPVSAFYADYYNACGAMEELFQSRLESDVSKEAADTLIYLAEHALKVSEGKVTFGWLLSTDTEGSFSSAVSGAAEGSGTITAGIEPPAAEDEEMELTPLMPMETPKASPQPEEDGESLEYTLNFQFGSGDSLSGTLTADCLEYGHNTDDGFSVEIIAEDNVWESRVIHGDGLTTILRCDIEGLHFSVIKSAETAENLNIYNWTSDSAGARRI